MQIIKTNQVSKNYSAVKAADELNIQVNQGEIYGLLGLNGAGKTTLIRMLLGMIKPCQGEIFLFSHKLDKHFQRWNEIGYMVETPHHYPNLTVLDNLRVFYKLRGLQNKELIGDILDKLKLDKYRHTKAGVLSMGNQQRLGLAKALMHSPPLLILDEPINGLDPEGIVEVRDMLKDLSARGTTILLSSHILEEISKLAHTIGIIHNGKLVRELSVSHLRQELYKKLVLRTRDNTRAKEILSKSGYQVAMTPEGDLELSGMNEVQNPEHITQLLCELQLPPVEIRAETEDLEQYFLRTIRQSNS